MNLGDLGRKAKDFLDSEQGEQRSDDALDRAARFADERTGGKHAEQIAQGREFADEHIGRTDGDEHRR